MAHTPAIYGCRSYLTNVGYSVTQSVWGAIAATIAVCLPSFILVLLISYFFVRCKDNKYIKAAMSGLLPMSVSLIAAAALLLMNKENFIDYRSSLIFAVAAKGTINAITIVVQSATTPISKGPTTPPTGDIIRKEEARLV